MNHPNERVDMTCAILRVANFAFYSLLQVVNIIMIVGIIRIVMCCHLHLLVALSSSPILLTQTQIIVCIGKYVYCISLWSEEWCLLSPTSSKHYCDHHHCCRYRNCCHRHYFRVSPSSSSFLFTHTCRPHHFCFVFFFFWSVPFLLNTDTNYCGHWLVCLLDSFMIWRMMPFTPSSSKHYCDHHCRCHHHICCHRRVSSSSLCLVIILIIFVHTHIGEYVSFIYDLKWWLLKERLHRYLILIFLS